MQLGDTEIVRQPESFSTEENTLNHRLWSDCRGTDIVTEILIDDMQSEELGIKKFPYCI